MSWIETIDPEHADARLAALYRRVAGASGQIDNILRAHSLRSQRLRSSRASTLPPPAEVKW